MVGHGCLKILFTVPARDFSNDIVGKFFHHRL
jgi:hypothetical protein